ncbi:hypothetical protein BT69DRAFT_1305863, partial [Atractiella rhizophila]
MRSGLVRTKGSTGVEDEEADLAAFSQPPPLPSPPKQLIHTYPLPRKHASCSPPTTPPPSYAVSFNEEPEEEKAKKGGFEYLNDVRRQEDIRVRALNSLGDRGADVLLFSFRVPRQVLEHLSKKGVSVAHDVKYRTMEAVERITRASIVTVPELEAYIVKMDEWETKETKEKEKKEREKEDTKRSGLFSLLKSKEKEESPAPPPITFGECTTFRLHTYVHTFIPERRKTIMRFEGCPKDLGCSLLLRGGTLENLGKVKRTLDMMVQLVYSLKLECHLLKEEGAGPVWPL